jgi:Transposase, Mutator family
MNRRQQFDSANIVSWKCILQVCDGSVAGVVDAPGPPSTRGAVRRYGWQGHGEPGVAEGEGRLGAWNACPLAEEPIVRLILDGTVVRVRLDRKATSISLLVVLGVREDGQKVLLALKNMGGESTETWRAVLDDLVDRGLHRPAFLIVDGAPGLEKAIAAIGDGLPVQRCTVHKHRNLLAHVPDRLDDEITVDYTDMTTRPRPRRSRRAATLSSASGGFVIAPSRTAWRKLATASSLSLACHRPSGAAQGPQTRPSVCTRSSSDGSKPRPCYRRPILLRCCSGRCSPQGRSTCGKSRRLADARHKPHRSTD